VGVPAVLQPRLVRAAVLHKPRSIRLAMNVTPPSSPTILLWTMDIKMVSFFCFLVAAQEVSKVNTVVNPHLDSIKPPNPFTKLVRSLLSGMNACRLQF
jgi:hypothetical protein